MDTAAPRPRPQAAAEVLVDFLNTRHVELDREDIPEPADLLGWATRHGLGDGLDALTPADVDDAHCLREALRQHLAGRAATAATGGTDAATTALEPATRDVRVGVIFADGAPSLTARGRGWPLLRGRLLLLLTRVSSDGHWDRLRICPGEQCAWAFYDRSRNSSRTWCSEQVCGARTRSRTYRRRRRDGTD